MAFVPFDQFTFNVSRNFLSSRDESSSPESFCKASFTIKRKLGKEIIDSKRSNWFFCILSAVIGWALGKFL